MATEHFEMMSVNFISVLNAQTGKKVIKNYIYNS